MSFQYFQNYWKALIIIHVVLRIEIDWMKLVALNPLAVKTLKDKLTGKNNVWITKPRSTLPTDQLNDIYRFVTLKNTVFFPIFDLLALLKVLLLI